MATGTVQAHMEGWELAVLFLVFLVITLIWDLLVGALTFLNNILRGRKASWLARVKEELLALGVVSLVLLFLEPTLQNICIKQKGASSASSASSYSPPAEEDSASLAHARRALASTANPCVEGERQVFPYAVISAAHYLLFYLAIVHILASLLSNVITNFKLSKWSVLERTARKEQNIPAVAFLRISSVVTRAVDPRQQSLRLRLHDAWRDFLGYVDQDLYALLRFMCEKRFRAHSVYLRNYNFLNMCEQCLEAEMNEIYSHAWLLVLHMALLLLYNQYAYQIVWFTAFCIVAMAFMAGNLRWVMKKTAREARNLWRRVQGMGGLERDENEQEDAGAGAGEAALPGSGRNTGNSRNTGKAGMGLGMGGGLARGSAWAPDDGDAAAAAAALMAAAQEGELKAAAKVRAGIGRSDMEAGDVGAQLRPDQIYGPGLHRVSASQRVSAHAMGRPLGSASRPLGEGSEAVGSASADPAAAGPSSLHWGANGGGDGTALRHSLAGAGAAAGELWTAAGGEPSSAGPLVPRPQYGSKPWLRPRTLVELVEAGRAVRSGMTGASACRPSARHVPPAPWSRRLRREPPAAAGSDGRGVGGGSAEPQRPGPGPVAEATVSNPLYTHAAVAGGGGVGAGAVGLAYGGQPGAPYVNGGVINGLQPGAGGVNGMAGGGFAGGGFGAGLAAAQQYGGMPAANMIAAAATAPYGGSGGGMHVPLAAGGGLPGVFIAGGGGAATGTGMAAPVALENGQWGSTPSSGGPEEGSEGESASGSSASGSRTSSGSESSGSGRYGMGHGGHGTSHGTSHGRGGEGGDRHDAHSERSMLEHELAYGTEEKITRLFFFGRPFLLLWLFNIIFAQASLTMTVSVAFVIPYDKFDSIRDVAQPLAIWLPVVLTNLLLVFYGCWVFLPQYAVLSVCGIREPHEIMEEIKRSKTQDASEEGVAAVVLDKLTGYFIGKHDGETRLSTAFIVSLASQAGIILGRDYKAARFINRRDLKPMYRELVMVWHDIAWYGELSSTYQLKTDVPAFREAFNELDEDGSGQLSFGELANMIRSLGTYATTGDVEAMLWEIDIDQSHSIGFDEFVKFLAYAFFDTAQSGYIDTRALMDGMDRLGMPVNEMQAAVMMSVGEAEAGGELRLSLRQFFEMYEKVAFEDEGDGEGDGASHGSGRDGVLGRALGALRAPSQYLMRTISARLSGGAGGGAGRGGGGGAGGGPGALRRQPSGTALAVGRSGPSGTSMAYAGGVGVGLGVGGGLGAGLGGFDAGVGAFGAGGPAGLGWAAGGGVMQLQQQQELYGGGGVAAGGSAQAAGGAGAAGRQKLPSRLAVVSKP